jgi:hypothetical protein
MKVFISHASKDQPLAESLAARLSEAGLEVWNPYEGIDPGDNWAMKVGQALTTVGTEWSKRSCP